MLNQNQSDRLNKQIANEAEVSRCYLAISRWAEQKGLSGVAVFFKAHHETEEQHMHKLENYVLETGGQVVVGALSAQRQEYSSITEVFKIAYEKEIEMSKNINSMVDSFLQEKDFSTFNFLQWIIIISV